MSISVSLASPADNPRIQRLVNQITMPGPATLSFQRAPDFFTGAQVIGDEACITVANDSERPEALAGLAVISGRELYINGHKKRVYYVGDARVDPFYRRKGIATAMFEVQRQHRTEDELLHLIMIKNNADPVEASSRMRKDVIFKLWMSHVIETSFIFTRKRTPRIPAGVQIRAATPEDVPLMQAFFNQEAPRRNGYPVYDFARMAGGRDPYYHDIHIQDYALAWRDGQMVGMLGSWNQKAFKQTRVMGFTRLVSAVRPLYNIYARWFGGFKLPPVGGLLNYLTLHTTLIRDDDPAVYRALIDWIMAHQGQAFDALACGVTQGDPLVEVPRTYKRQKLYSHHFWASYGEDPRPGIDNRPLFVELGRL